MFDISRDGVITLTRGDSFEAPLFINMGTDLDPMRYDMTDNNAEIYFGLMEANQPFERALVRKKYTKADVNEYGDVVVKFIPEDTVEIIPGVYYYQIKIRIPTDDTYEVNTVVKKTKFIIEE